MGVESPILPPLNAHQVLLTTSVVLILRLGCISEPLSP